MPAASAWADGHGCQSLPLTPPFGMPAWNPYLELVVADLLHCRRVHGSWLTGTCPLLGGTSGTSAPFHPVLGTEVLGAGHQPIDDSCQHESGCSRVFFIHGAPSRSGRAITSVGVR